MTDLQCLAIVGAIMLSNNDPDVQNVGFYFLVAAILGQWLLGFLYTIERITNG